MSDIPPLTPADCDLRGLPFMPLHGERLIDSDLFFESTGDEFKAAFALWWASWKQVPAASLPDNPRVLAGLARVADAKRWAKVSELALHGWIKCSDGRLYHPVIAELANEAWAERQDHRAGRDAERERKQAEREERKRLFADLKAAGVRLAWNVQMSELRASHLRCCPQVVQDLSSGQVADRPAPVAAIEGTGTVEGTGTLFEGADAPIAESRPKKSTPDPALVERLWACQPVCGGKRKATRPEVDKALKGALSRGGEPRQIEAAFRAYYALPDCQRDGGQFARGAAVLLNDDKWRDFASGSSGPQGTDWPDSRWLIAVGLWRDEGAWGESLGPPPGQPGCRVPPHLLIQPTAHGTAA